jgi:hypothetical protein
MTTAVHELVANALGRLDSQLEIKRTDYFNHSFVPDLVLRWGSGDERHERYVHLRFSVVEKPLEDDIRLLGEASPIFLGMTDERDLTAAAWPDAAHLNGTLVTQTAAIDDFESSVRKDSRTRSATGQIVRLGHGRLDEPAAENVGSTFINVPRAIDSDDDSDEVRPKVQTALEALNPLLPEPGEILVERTLQSEWIRQGRDPDAFPARAPWRPELLDWPSLREVLLSLLHSDRIVEPETWVRNAGFIRTEDIGNILGENMHGGAFNAMAHALLSSWTAKRVWAKRAESAPLFETYDWFVAPAAATESRLLGLEVNDLEIFFADDGRHFKDKEGGNVLPRLAEAQNMLSEPGVQNVGLRGLREGIRYERLGGAGAVFERLQEILAAPRSETYRIQTVTTVVPGTDWVADVDLDRQIIDVRGQATPVAQLARLATRFFSRAPSIEGLDHFLATGEQRATA